MMKTAFGACLPLVLAAALWCAPAVAQTSPPPPPPTVLTPQNSVAPLLRQWGLLGTWSYECNKPPAPDNGHWLYVARSNASAYVVFDDGDGLSSATVINAQVLQGNLLEIVLSYKPGTPSTVNTLKLENGQLTTMWSFKQGTQDFTIRDGIIVAKNAKVASRVACPPK
jgi:hypothetical protein